MATHITPIKPTTAAVVMATTATTITAATTIITPTARTEDTGLTGAAERTTSKTRAIIARKTGRGTKRSHSKNRTDFRQDITAITITATRMAITL